jgi:hypothetical protein
MAEIIGECIFLIAIFSCGVMMGWSTRSSKPKDWYD